MIKRNDSERYILSLDNGGTYIKAALYTEKGRQLAVSKCRNHLVMPQPNYAEYDQDELWNANCNSIKDLICTAGIDPSEIAAVFMPLMIKGKVFGMQSPHPTGGHFRLLTNGNL